MKDEMHIRNQLQFLFGDWAEQIWLELQRRINEFLSRNPSLSSSNFDMNESDAVLITYGDQFQDKDQQDLGSLIEFLGEYLKDEVNWVHLLPFYPYSSDDGFSVIDYRRVNPDIGTWDDISLLAEKYQLMFDAVVNHISRESDWFQAFKRGESPYKDYFRVVDPNTDLSSIFRPRALPLLTPIQTIDGEKFVWTTFSDDQIDLDYSNPQVLLEVIDLLLFYAEKGARLIRLDAIGYVWKLIGTSSLNLPQAHSIVKIENFKYFGESLEDDGLNGKPVNGDEAQLIYQFSLAPLILHTFNSTDINALSNWVETLSVPYQNTAFFNFIASHDGIGVMPAKGLLSEDEIEALIDKTISHGGEPSYKTNSDGSKSVYELNITLFDALNNPSDENPELDVNRFLASQAIMLSLAGVPGIYVHSLFGSRNCLACVEETGRARSINREKFSLPELRKQLNDPENIHSQVFRGYKKLLSIRKNHPAFHPASSQKVLYTNNQVFSLIRSDPDQKGNIICLINVSSGNQEVEIDLRSLRVSLPESLLDLLSEKSFIPTEGILNLKLEGFQTKWLLASDKTTKS
jgi:sucrose phosphorylase